MEIALRMYARPYLQGAYDQQLQRGAFILKDETDKEQTSHINVQYYYQLSHVALMSTEVGILRKINFGDLVTKFSNKKELKVSLL